MGIESKAIQREEQKKIVDKNKGDGDDPEQAIGMGWNGKWVSTQTRTQKVWEASKSKQN